MAKGIISKPYQIKAWSELVGLNPLLKAHDTLPQGKFARLNLDFSQVHQVDAIGLSIFLARVVQARSMVSDATITIDMPTSRAVASTLESLGLKMHLARLGLELSLEQRLFDQIDDVPASAQKCLLDEQLFHWETVVSIRPGQGDRDQLISYAKREIKNFLNRDEARRFVHEQVMIILLEMVKNTFDHSGRPALLGLSFIESSARKGKFAFSYCDTGEGISRTVRHHIKTLATQSGRTESLDAIENELSSEKTKHLIRLSQNGAFSDILHWALQPGHSTKSGNGVNFGLGLMYIVEGSRKCGIRLSLKEADSMWILTQLSSPYSHAEIRRFGINTCSPSLLMFFGELEYSR
ncbi:MAG: hypothetical protein Q8N74_01825 [Sulfuricella sp.]|nr:hypothetical protein [Sulfuricella sp.]